MGKKTDTAMKSIASTEQKCAVFVADISALTPEMEEMIAEMVVLSDRMTARTEFHMPGGSQSSEGEKAVEADPQFQQAAREHDVIAAKFTEMGRKKNAAVAGLKKELLTLKKSIADFQVMLDKKKKSWFGTKNSVPAAEEFLDASTKYLIACNRLAR